MSTDTDPTLAETRLVSGDLDPTALSDMWAPAVPVTLGKYRIDSVLGEGAMGTVYRGFDPVLERPVAIKTLNAELLRDYQRDEFLVRFRREAQAAARLNHPNIVTVHDYGEDQGVPYIAMELIQGQDLKAFLRDNRRPGLDWSLQLMRQLLDALDYCHAQGVVHRDLKPANIFLLPTGQIRIGDFGVARVQGSDLTRFNCQIGTFGYMSPEQFLGRQADARSDLFSAGVILYELLAGSNPMAEKPMADVAYDPITRIDPSLPPGIDKVLRKALAIKPEERFQTARGLADALNGLTPVPAPRPIRKRLLAVALAVVLPVVAALSGWLIWDRYGVPQPPPLLGAIQLATQPPGADVWLGDRRLGATPLHYELPVGRHEIVLKKDGYDDLPAALDVEAGADMDLDLQLTPSHN